MEIPMMENGLIIKNKKLENIVTTVLMNIMMVCGIRV
jgi:hypothetical protein